MSANPFDAPVSAAFPRRRVLKTRMIWFLFGFACSWLCWSTIGYVRMRPRDHARNWPQELRELSPDWMKYTRGRKLGEFVVFVAGEPSNASAMIYPVAASGNGVVFSDDNVDGTIDSILVTDARGRSWTIGYRATDDGADSFTFATGSALDAATFSDSDLDGQYDIRLGPGYVGENRGVAVWIDSQWRELEIRDGKQYVDVEGDLIEVNAEGGVWQRVAGD